MGVDSSGRCPICMEQDSLEHMMFECRYSLAIQKRQTWSEGIKTVIAGHTPRAGRVSSGREDRHLSLMQLMRELFDRHPERILLWRTIWPESVRVALTQGCGGGSISSAVGSGPGSSVPSPHGAPVYKTGFRGTVGNQRNAIQSSGSDKFAPSYATHPGHRTYTPVNACRETEVTL